MESARLVLHVGAHKTGSSLIQKFLRDRPRELRAHRIGYLSRQDLDPLVSRGSLERNDWSGLTSAVDAAVAAGGTDVVIASHEGTMGPAFPRRDPSLYSRSAGLAPRLAEALGSHRPTVVVTLRPQADFVESYYLQSIHTGRHDSFASWLSGLDLDRLSWRPLVDDLTAAFGADRVHVLDFRTIRDGQEAFVRRFLALAAPGRDVPVSYPAVRNASISGKGLELALAVNPLLTTHDERRSMRRFLQKHFSNRDFARPTLLGDELRAQLENRYAAEYDELVAGQTPNSTPWASGSSVE